MRFPPEIHRSQISIKQTRTDCVQTSRDWREAAYSVRHMPTEDSIELPCGLKEHVLAISHNSVYVKARIDDQAFERVQPAHRITFLPAEASHSAEFKGKGPFRVVEHIAIQPKLLAGFAESFECEIGSLDPLFNLNHEPLQAGFSILRNVTSKPSEPSQLFVDTVLQNIVTHMLLAASSRRDHICRKVSRQMPRENISRVSKALDFLEAKACDNPSLADVARVQGLSEFHFSRVFRRATATLRTNISSPCGSNVRRSYSGRISLWRRSL